MANNYGNTARKQTNSYSQQQGQGQSRQQGQDSSSTGDGSTSTTHYAYMLNKDAEGNILKDENGNAAKTFVDGVYIYENEGKFGNYLKLRVTGPVPEGDIFVVKKRPKS